MPPVAVGVAWFAVPKPAPLWQVEQVMPAKARCLAWALARLGAVLPLGGTPWHDPHPGLTAGLVAWQLIPLIAVGLMQLTLEMPPMKSDP